MFSGVKSAVLDYLQRILDRRLILIVLWITYLLALMASPWNIASPTARLPAVLLGLQKAADLPKGSRRRLR